MVLVKYKSRIVVYLGTIESVKKSLLDRLKNVGEIYSTHNLLIFEDGSTLFMRPISFSELKKRFRGKSNA